MSNNNNKSLDVLIIGMGFSGICAAIKLIKNNITNIQIHEKSEGIGGTWHDNIYPGAACDVPSHLYCYSFEPNPNWSRRYAKQAEIKKYLENCVNKYDILKYAKFSSKVVSMVYQEKPQTWDVTFDNGNVISANHVIHAGGGIHKPKIPNFKDLSKFQGKIMHTAKWDKHTELINKNIGIIGSAASAIQVIPEIAKVAKQLKVFQRTPNYIIPRGDRAYKSSEKQRFRKFPWLLKLLRWFFYMRLEFITFPVIRKNSYLGKRAAKSIIKYMKSSIKNSSLKEFFVPDYSLGCKRILLSDNLFHAINRDNVEVITNEILSFNESGITTNDLNKYNFDVIVMATGFDIEGHMHSIKVKGINNQSLSEVWRESAQAYKGSCVSGFPNFFMVTGPNTGAGTISLVHIIEQEVNFIVRLIKLAGTNSSIEVKNESLKKYNHDIQSKLKDTVWSSGCSSWYLDKNGKNITLYPEHGRSFKKQLSTVKMNDFIIKNKTQSIVTQ